MTDERAGSSRGPGPTVLGLPGSALGGLVRTGGALGGLVGGVAGGAIHLASSGFGLRHGRRVWEGDGRTHVEARALSPAMVEPFAHAVSERLVAIDGVEWAEFNSTTRRVVIGHERGTVPIRDLVAALEEIEALLDLAHERFVDEGLDHPADTEPLGREVIALGADLAGLGISSTLRLLRLRPPPFVREIAAGVAFTDNVPRVRRVAEQRLGRPATDVSLAVVGALASGLGQGPLGPFVDLIHRSARIAEIATRNAAWSDREPGLCAEPTGLSHSVPEALEELPPRPSSLPRGPIETYSERAWVVSLGAFGVTLPVSRNLERASAALTAGLPKAARLGREAFAVELGRRLAANGVLTLDSGVLRLLDRVTVVVVEAALVPDSSAVVDAVARAGLDLWLAGAPASSTAGLPRHRIVPQGPELVEAIRSAQADGEVVLAVGGGSFAGLAVADCAVGIPVAGRPHPWTAHLLAGDVADAAQVIDACPIARDVSEQSVTIALAGASVGGLIALGGVLPGTGVRVMTAVNLASLVALANGTRTGLGSVKPSTAPVSDLTTWHTLDGAVVLERLDSHTHGLTAGEARDRLVRPDRPDPAALRIARAVGDELVNPLTPILAMGAGLSVAVGSVADAALVTGVLGINALIGGVQRFRAERAIEGLMHVNRQQVLVRRDGIDVRIDAAALVPGDMVRLEAGDAVLYRGAEALHWREPLDGADWYLQVFLHYVDADGPYADRHLDGRANLGQDFLGRSTDG